MLTAVIISSILLVVFSLTQLLFGFSFGRWLRGSERSQALALQSGILPKVSVVLSLRGADPDMENGLRAFMSQQYANYDLRIVVDRETDPAWEVVHRVIAQTGFTRVHVTTLGERTGKCSLKNSAMVQLARGLDADCEVMVMADGDLVCDPTWLTELIAPLADAKVGAVSGLPWFWAPEGQGGSLVRYLWFSATAVAMKTFRMAWGGTLAIRAEILRDTNLLDLWSKAMNEEHLLIAKLKERNLKLELVPSLVMVNREECSLSFILGWIKRQMFNTRMYQPSWPFIFLHMLGSSGLLLFLLVAGIAGVVLSDANLMLWSWGSLFAYELMMLISLIWIEGGVRRAVATRGETPLRFGLGRWLKIIAALPLTQFCHAAATISSVLQQHLVWRGVVYKIDGPFDVRIVRDEPLQQTVGQRLSQSI